MQSIEKRLETLKSISPKIAITKTTFLTPIPKPQSQQPQQKPLYTTLTAKQITTTEDSAGGNLSVSSGSPIVVDTTITSSTIAKTTHLSTVALKDLKDIIKPLSNKSLAGDKSKARSASSGEPESYNMAIVAAKRPQLTIVATKTIIDPIQSATTPVAAAGSALTAPIITIQERVNYAF